MIGRLATACAPHRAPLLDFADSRDAATIDAASLDHLDRCSACRADVEATALAVIALRRLAAEAESSEAPSDGWARLRGRVARRASPWRWRAPLAGLLVSVGLVAIMVAPAARLRPAAPYIQEAGIESSIFDAQRAADDRGDQQAMQLLRAARSLPVPADQTEPVPLDLRVFWAGPDGRNLERLYVVAPAPTVVRQR
jgi:hypothetical protein